MPSSGPHHLCSNTYQDIGHFFCFHFDLYPDTGSSTKTEIISSFFFLNLQSLAARLRLRRSLSKFTKQLKQSPVQDFLLNRNHANLILPPSLSTPIVYCLPKAYEMDIDFETGKKFHKMYTFLPCRPPSELPVSQGICRWYGKGQGEYSFSALKTWLKHARRLPVPRLHIQPYHGTLLLLPARWHFAAYYVL